MKSSIAVVLSVFALIVGTAGAQADPVTTLTFSGHLYSAYDGAGLFGPSGTNYTSSTQFTATLSYDPTPLGACNSPPSGCTWTLTSAEDVVETLTLNGHTATFDVSSGQLQFETGGGNSDQIDFNNLSNTGFSAQDQFGDGSSFFGNPPNLSPALHFASLSTSYGGGSGNAGQTSFNLDITTVSAVTSVPEPSSLVVLGSGLVGLGWVRRRLLTGKKRRPRAGSAGDSCDQPSVN